MNALLVEPISASTNPNINIVDEHTKRQTIINPSIYVDIFVALLGNAMDTQVLPQSQIADIRSIERVLNQTYDLDNTTSNSIEINSPVVVTLEEAQPRAMSLSEALKREEEIFTDLQERKRAARLAEAEYWKFLNNDED